MPAIHYSSHASLLQRYRPGGRFRLNAIVVSATRPADNLCPALRLGATLNVPVVLLCSHAARTEDAAAKAEAVPGATCVAVDISGAPRTHIPDFETSRFRQAQVGSLGDLSFKRNLGLVLGRVAGWQTVLFLDDDIEDLDPDQVTKAAAALEYFVAVGMPANHFPDNSVVCHAHRLSGRDQGVFVSGSALAVNVRRADSFFPDTYNEDWLFLAPHLDVRNVASHDRAWQQRYAPFKYPHRAGAQEFGDVLAEGLIGFLHAARLRPPPPIEYWEAFIESRAAFISRTMESCKTAAMQNVEAAKAMAALEIAEQTLSAISAADLTDYVEAWLHDLVTWRQLLGALSRAGSLLAAVHHLDLSAVTVTSCPSPALQQA